MSLGTALIVVAVLYLIDKHGLWRPAAKIAGALTVLALLVFGAVYGWNRYTNYKAAVAFAARQKRIGECEKRFAAARLTSAEPPKQAGATISTHTTSPECRPGSPDDRYTSLETLRARHTIDCHPPGAPKDTIIADPRELTDEPPTLKEFLDAPTIREQCEQNPDSVTRSAPVYLDESGNPITK
jgi:hypothetical protein